MTCDNCRVNCNGNCHEKLTAILDGTAVPGTPDYENNKDLLGRKQIIHCLGPYCDDPCELNRTEYTPFNEEDGLNPLINAIKYLGNVVNDRISEENRAC